ncbi:MAG TPA: TIGR00725 family protein [Planctomycetes bacterium]|nr:TIGR00725 family protein [Planctomycetota bacterium]
MRKVIAVVGGSAVSRPVLNLAERVGKAVAEAGAVLLTGGRGGVMEAACKGCREAGGLNIAFLPGPDRSQANRFVDIAFPTDLGEARNALVAGCAHAVVALEGGSGTLSEIALGLKRGVPVVSLGGWKVAGVVEARGPEEAVSEALRLGT